MAKWPSQQHHHPEADERVHVVEHEQRVSELVHAWVIVHLHVVAAILTLSCSVQCARWVVLQLLLPMLRPSSVE